VEIVEVKGDWTRVRRTGAPVKGETPEGWAKSSNLQELPDKPAAPAKRR
jgi:hypothetical protein